MKDAIYTCPFCDHPPWRTRIMLWRHIRECMQKTQGTVNLLTPNEPAVVLNQ